MKVAIAGNANVSWDLSCTPADRCTSLLLLLFLLTSF